MSKNKLLLSVLLTASMTLNAETGFLSEQEKHSLTIVNKLLHSKQKSISNGDGSVTFLYGRTMPSILTAPFRLTDITLAPGEVIQEIQIGDTVRWVLSPAISGTDNNKVSHVVVKPTESNLETSLAIYTDRRAYYLNLRSTVKKYFPIVSFAYENSLKDSMSAYTKNMKKMQKAEPKFALKGHGFVDLTKVNFNYKIRGTASWKPKRVYDDGVKTYIELPSSVINDEAPALLVVDENKQQQLVNYRYSNGKYIVDKVFKRAILVLGVGFSQSKISITRN